MHDRNHNQPPDPIDEAIAPYDDAITEAQNWLDGTTVENAEQMKAVDALLKDIKAAKKAVGEAEESEAKPIYDQWKAAKARYKPTLDDLDRIAKGLVSIVGAFKKRLAEQKAEEERQARAKAAQAAREAEEKARMAAAGDIEAQRAADQAKAEADTARKAATASKGEKVLGLRTVQKYEIEDHRAALHSIARNDRDAITGFVEDYVRRNHKTTRIDGVRQWTDREAF